ncbi:DUF3710 domain-containing protein [Arthrobacter sp. Sa2CUA1]|uniref:DUF3710 domain-containing protein n=1 Tax=Arthrobacter gallicola TaxID=2762225 RepID=A0ABR8UMP5_9MICC|nr:DUF3710 domain-containing protein [Arthrobacter gallicola]MBD7993822.1 DUF3710 domain-containing protein [Arthrobacter gallicola]
MAFGRRKKTNPQSADAAGSAEAPVPPAGTGKDAAGNAGRGPEHGPFDAEDRPSEEGYVDLGALRIAATQGLALRLEVEEKTKRVVAVTLDLDGSSLQLQAFAAPRSETLWDEIRAQIVKSVSSQGGTADELEGRLGTELLARVPAQAQDGSKGYRVARFVGVDGPRWFLRGVFGGPAAMNPEAAAPLEEVFRNVVVVRGDAPLPPRDLLQLTLPKDASPLPRRGTEATGDASKPEPPQRGPEITTIG